MFIFNDVNNRVVLSASQNNQRICKLAEPCADVFKVICNTAMKDKQVLSPNRCMLEYIHSEGFQPEMSHIITSSRISL